METSESVDMSERQAAGAASGRYWDVSETSSVNTELEQAADRGARSSFRESSSERYSPAIADEDSDQVRPKTVDVYNMPVLDGIVRGTPESTASSTRHMFLRRDGTAGSFDVGKFQGHFSGRNNAESTMRNVAYGTGQGYDNKGADFNQDNGTFGRKRLGHIPSREPPEIKQKSCLPRCLLVLLFVLCIVGAIIAIVITGKSSSSEQHGIVLEEEEEIPPKEYCDEVAVKLGEMITVNCQLVGSLTSTPEIVNITPPIYVNQGQPVTVNLAQRGVREATPMSGWTGSIGLAILHLNGPTASCSSGGVYKLQVFGNNNKTVSTAEMLITVKSEILKVNVSLKQSTEDNHTDFTIGCSTKSGCEQSFVDFFAEINKEEQYLRGVNFSCTIEYNDYDGYSVSCMGRIPDFLMSQFGKITCRPRSKLLDDLKEEEKEELEEILELPDCDLTKHCGYECKDVGDYYVVNTGRCDIFHRCFTKQVYTSFCAPGTFFDPFVCACRHTTDLPWCQANGALKPNEDVTKMECYTGNNTTSQ